MLAPLVLPSSSVEQPKLRAVALKARSTSSRPTGPVSSTSHDSFSSPMKVGGFGLGVERAVEVDAAQLVATIDRSPTTMTALEISEGTIRNIILNTIETPRARPPLSCRPD